jgi:hypothetical protein
MNESKSLTNRYYYDKNYTNLKSCRLLNPKTNSKNGSMEAKKVLLTEDEMPRQWYNVLADIKMNPPLGPDGNSVSPDQLASVFPMNLIEQVVSSERWIDIPEEVFKNIKHLASLPADQGLCPRKRAGYTGSNLLQI